MQTSVPRMLGGVIGPVCLGGNRTAGGDERPGETSPMTSYITSKHVAVALSEGRAGHLDQSPIGVSVLCPAHHGPSHMYENSAWYRPARFGGPMGDGNRLAAEADERPTRKATSTPPSSLPGW